MNACRLGRRAAPATALIVLFAISLASPGRAAAGEFTITDCGADGINYATSAFENFATRGMRWRRACDPQGPGLRGLVTANVAGSGRVAEGAQSAFVMEAPPGTTFSRFRWSGAMHRRDCRYALQLYAVRPDESAVPIKNVRANRHCPPSGDAQASGWPHPRAYDLGGATRIVQRVVCVGGSGEQSCSARGQNYVQTFTVEATVVDDSGPSVSIVPEGPLARGEWVRGKQTLGYEASDNVGIKEAWVSSASGSVGHGEGRACDYAQRVPCPNGPGQLEVETERLPREGTQELHVTAKDAAGNQSDSSPVVVRIDNAAPGAVPVGVEGGEAWRNRDAYNLAWQNPAEVDRAPIVAAHYRLCRAGTNECSLGEGAGAGVAGIANLTVPAPGEWELRMWRQDAAGNQQPENASVPVKLRFDPEPPQLGFEAPSSSDPTRDGLELPCSEDGFEDKGEGEEIKVFTREQLAAILAMAPEDHKLLFEVLAGCGLRISEAIALQRLHFQLDDRAPEVCVRRAIVKGRVGPPKSKYGRRDIRLALPLAASVRARLAAEGDRAPEALVFAGNSGGGAISIANLRRRYLKPLAEEVGAPWAGFHTFRHTFASLHIAAGTNIVQLSRVLGHHSAAFTLSR